MTTKFAAPQPHVLAEAWLLSGRDDLRHTTLVDIDFDEVTLDWSETKVDDTTLFIGCRLELEDELALRRRGATFLAVPDRLPYRPLRRELYDWRELTEPTGEGRSYDLDIYEHFAATRVRPSLREALYQRLHDFSMDEGLRRLLDFGPDGLTRRRRCVGFMGGHSTGRDTEDYRRSVLTAKLLTEAGYFVVSGGGPGIMEAANLGAYLAGTNVGGGAQVQKVLDKLAEAPKYTDPGYEDKARWVLDRYPDGAESLAIPTWFYGHEPSNLFATYIAKYFSNSIREDTLLAIALHGIVFAPGSAGTTQEIFMDAAQNHYATFDYVSPMIFLGRHRYTVETQLYPTLQQLAAGRTYADYLALTDVPAEVVAFIEQHPPRRPALAKS